MRETRTKVLFQGMVLAVVLAAADGVALPGRGLCAADWDNQITVTGTVVSPEMLAPCPRGTRELTYAYIDANDDKGQSRHWYVMLGPASGPAQPLRLTAGEKVSVTGAAVDDDVLVAASVERDGQTVHLRGPYGRPAWGGGCRTTDAQAPCGPHPGGGRGAPRSW